MLVCLKPKKKGEMNKKSSREMRKLVRTEKTDYWKHGGKKGEG